MFPHDPRPSARAEIVSIPTAGSGNASYERPASLALAESRDSRATLVGRRYSIHSRIRDKRDEEDSKRGQPDSERFKGTALSAEGTRARARVYICGVYYPRDALRG